MVSLSPDTVVVVDSVDNKIVQILDSSTGKSITKLVHSAEVSTLHLNQHCLGPQERILVFVDCNRDLFIASLNIGASGPGVSSPPIATFKLHSHVDSFCFNDETDVLVGLADGRLAVWYYPSVVFVDKDLLSLTLSSSDGTEFGRSAQIISYTGNRVSIRKVDGSILFSGTQPDIPLLYDLTRSSKWDEAVRLCRHQKIAPLWATLSTMAIAKKQLDTAEIALSEVSEVAKVYYYFYYDYY
jgi:intraflagellar transport protein 80